MVPSLLQEKKRQTTVQNRLASHHRNHEPISNPTRLGGCFLAQPWLAIGVDGSPSLPLKQSQVLVIYQWSHTVEPCARTKVQSVVIHIKDHPTTISLFGTSTTRSEGSLMNSKPRIRLQVCHEVACVTNRLNLEGSRKGQSGHTACCHLLLFF